MSFDLNSSVYVSTDDDLDAKYRVANDTERDLLITNQLIKIGHTIYKESDNKKYLLSAYPTVGDATTAVWTDEGSGGGGGGDVLLTTASQLISSAATYAVGTSAGTVTLTVDENTGHKSFGVFDASQSFSVSNPCVVDFGTLTYPVGFIKEGVNVGDQLVGVATLQTKNDSYLFYFGDEVWRYLDMATKNGGIV